MNEIMPRHPVFAPPANPGRRAGQRQGVPDGGVVNPDGRPEYGGCSSVRIIGGLATVLGLKNAGRVLNAGFNRV